MRLVPLRYRPEVWFVCFRHETPWWPMRWLTWGSRWKHVACYGFIPGQRLWVLYEYTFHSIAICVAPETGSDALLSALEKDALIVAYPARRHRRRWSVLSLCTTSVAAIIGSKSRALRPSRFLRDLIAEGGEVISEPRASVTTGRAAAPGRPA